MFLKHVTFFGHHYQHELQNLSSTIEFAFDQYRQNLMTMMNQFDDMLIKLKEIDKFTNYQFLETHRKIEEIAANYPIWWEHNEISLRQLLNVNNLNLVYAILPPLPTNIDDGSSLKNPPSILSSNQTSRDVLPYNSLIQLLIHISRDWAAMGSAVREKLYNQRIIPKTLQYLPLEDDGSSAPLILIPGAGAGRLAWELATLGYRIEANECSGTMITYMNSLLNQFLPHNQQTTIYPYLHLQLKNDWDLERRSQMVTIPYLDDAYFHHFQSNASTSSSSSSSSTSLPGGKGSFVVQSGDFLEIYGRNHDYENFYDGIITNFFIDTGKNILEYLEIIKIVLKLHGIWINLGPLHYHNTNTIPYSYKHLVEIIQQMGFEIMVSEIVENSYCGEERISMKPEVYHVPFNVFRLIEKQPKLEISANSSQCNRNTSIFHRPNYKLIS